MARIRGASPDPKIQAARVVRSLVKLYPTVVCALDHRNAFELLVATVLSAQCTDERVNKVTPELFARFPDPQALANAELADVEALVYTTGFFRAKARNLIALSRTLVEKHGGEVPADLDALTALPGVGRKTANVVLGNAFAIPSGVVVDTHVKRLAYRLGLTTRTDPEVIEQELNALLAKKHWIDFSHRLIAHGRSTCDALRPLCQVCPLNNICPREGLAS
jgi:endonuclease-3